MKKSILILSIFLFALQLSVAEPQVKFYCYYNFDPSICPSFGKLYNWYAVNDQRGLAPSGWHVASDPEWTELTDMFGGESWAGGSLREAGTKHWDSTNVDGTNISGFTAIGSGAIFLLLIIIVE